MLKLSANEAFAVGRIKAKKKMPYFAAQLFSAVPIEKPGIGTACVDKHCRIYYDPEFITKCDPEEVAGVILHEIMHPAQLHHKRCIAKLGEEAQDWEYFLWNMAGDLTINPILRECQVTLPKGCLFPEKFSLPENLSTEEYYELLRENPEKYVKFVPAPGSNPKPGEGSGGSGADGQQKAWEFGAPGKPGDGDQAGGQEAPPGLSDFEQTMLARQSAEKIEAAKMAGKVPAGLARWAKEILDPKIDPKRELLALVKHGISQAAGMKDFTYRRPSRRRPTNRIVFPSMIATVPRLTICIDTSGSMCGEALGLGLGLVQSVVKALPDQRGVLVLAGDTRVEAAKKVFSAKQVELAGGGGTDMRELLRDAVERTPRPQLVVLFTDGYTPWPHTPMAVPTVAVICGDGGQDCPEWMKTVRIKESAS